MRAVARLFILARKVFQSYSLKTKLLVTLLPFMVIATTLISLFNYRITKDFITIGLERNVRLRNSAISNKMTTLLENCRKDLLVLAAETPNTQTMVQFLTIRNSIENTYREVAFIPANEAEYIHIISDTKRIFPLSKELFNTIEPSPFIIDEAALSLRRGEVLLNSISQAVFPSPNSNSNNHKINVRILRFVTPYFVKDQLVGHYVLSIDAKIFRHVLSVYNSQQSPLNVYSRSDEIRFSYFVDLTGWILFQSEELDRINAPLDTSAPRSRYPNGLLGKPGLPNAFLPDRSNKLFWEMIKAINEGNSGSSQLKTNDNILYFIAYSPVYFTVSPGNVIPYGAVIYSDRSALSLVAEEKYIRTTFAITSIVIAIIAGVIFYFSRMITTPIQMLTATVHQMYTSGKLKEIDLFAAGPEVNELKRAINSLICTVTQQYEEIYRRDKIIQSVSLREKASLLEEYVVLQERHCSESTYTEIIGIGDKVAALKNNITKAAQVDVDVLIIGETGTGKQLTAEAIHNNSSRSDKPLLSLNCGALDESLLLDALFGHIKGAYTEANADRKGSFLEADGGTLFLDEIQSASPKVQQALLRAIAIRRIRPLGSDHEIQFNTRIIAATNADLRELIIKGQFREDLYYRLKVLSIDIPPLRDHKESIPLLTHHYLKQTETHTNLENRHVSKGVMKRFLEYHWPGNIRELINCITRAAIMSEDSIIQVEDIKLGAYEETPSDFIRSEHSETVTLTRDTDETLPATDNGDDIDSGIQVNSTSESLTESTQVGDSPHDNSHLPLESNTRQKAAWEQIIKKGSVTRSEYLSYSFKKISSRTANYDLQELVHKGLLKKVGKGPVTKYVVIKQ